MQVGPEVQYVSVQYAEPVQITPFVQSSVEVQTAPVVHPLVAPFVHSAPSVHELWPVQVVDAVQLALPVHQAPAVQ